jgi:hypothetical protein
MHDTTPRPRQHSLREWEIETYIGLFRPGRRLLVTAESQIDAECAADICLNPDEWFPCFSATPI